jgi:hypothetical protein
VKGGHHFPKAYGIKVRRYGKNVGEHIGNPLGTHWELERNIVRTHWETRKNGKKISLPPSPGPPTPKHKKKKRKAP